MTYECPKCNRYGMEWDGRAKILICCYKDCNHVVHIPNQIAIPDEDIILNAIENDENKKKSDFIKYCEKVGKIVKTWPKWKQNLLGTKDYDQPKSKCPYDSEWDGTDAACPAFWRGEKWSVNQFCRLIADVLSGKNNCTGRMYNPLETVRNNVFKLKQERDKLAHNKKTLLNKVANLENSFERAETLMTNEFKTTELKAFISRACSKNICGANKALAISYVVDIESKLKGYGLYKEYLYYVDIELTCKRTPNKYCKWLSEKS